MERIYHTWDKWECYRAGFYENAHPGISKIEGDMIYKDFLSSPSIFELGLKKVLSKWKMSCEHYLTNEKMNRIAWLGQASVSATLGIPSCHRSGYFLMSKDNQGAADMLALKYLNLWLKERSEKEVDLTGAGTKSHANLY